MKLELGLIIEIEQTISELEKLHYSRTKLVLNPGEYAVRGSIIDVYPIHQNVPVRIELFDTVIDDIRTFEPSTQRSVSKMDRIQILPYDKNAEKHDYIIPHEVLFELNVGDKVVHVNHGIGIYQGLQRMKFGIYEGEYAVVEYQHEDKIFIPIEQLTRILDQNTYPLLLFQDGTFMCSNKTFFELENNIFGVEFDNYTKVKDYDDEKETHFSGIIERNTVINDIIKKFGIKVD